MTEITIYNKWFKTEEDYTQATILNALKDAIDSSASNNGKPIVSGSLPCSLCNGTGRQIPYYDVAKYYEDDGNDH